MVGEKSLVLKAKNKTLRTERMGSTILRLMGSKFAPLVAIKTFPSEFELELEYLNLYLYYSSCIDKTVFHKGGNGGLVDIP